MKRKFLWKQLDLFISNHVGASSDTGPSAVPASASARLAGFFRAHEHLPASMNGFLDLAERCCEPMPNQSLSCVVIGTLVFLAFSFSLFSNTWIHLYWGVIRKFCESMKWSNGTGKMKYFTGRLCDCMHSFQGGSGLMMNVSSVLFQS